MQAPRARTTTRAAGSKTISTRNSFAARLVASLAALTRTNGLALVTVAFLCASRAEKGRRTLTISAASLGFLLPWFVWYVLSHQSGSPFFPSRNYIDVAVHFFGAEGARLSSNSDNWAQVEEHFSSISDVLLHDPAKLVGGFLNNVATFWWRLFGDVFRPVGFVVGLAVLPAVALLIFRRPDLSGFAFWLVFASQYAVLCLRSFFTRGLLFIAPIAGSAIAVLAEHLVGTVASSPKKRIALAIVAAAVTLPPIIYINGKTLQRLYASEATDAMAKAAKEKKTVWVVFDASW